MVDTSEIIWSIPARDDLQDIYDYIYDHSEKAALELTDAIVAKVEFLKRNTQSMGQTEPLLRSSEFDYYFIMEGNYKIIYRVEIEKLFIISIFDVRTNPEVL